MCLVAFHFLPLSFPTFSLCTLMVIPSLALLFLSLSVRHVLILVSSFCLSISFLVLSFICLLCPVFSLIPTLSFSKYCSPFVS